MKLTELEAVIESLLFITGDSISLKIIAQTIGMDKATTKAIISSLANKYLEEKRGLQVVEFDGSYQLCTSPQCFEFIRDMYKTPKKQGLTQALLETLAIVAYKQPITKSQVEEIRGVSAEHTINKLMEKRLVCEVGRLDTPGKPILFGTTEEFLRYFGFTSTNELPYLNENTFLEEDEKDIAL